MFTEILGLVETIPAAFWGVVIGSFYSLGGIYLTNRSNDRRLRAQLAHDREIRNRERELSLRKDIYLAAAEAISAGLNAIGRFADLELPHNQLTASYLEKSASIAKVHVIAKEDTARAVAAFLGDLSSTYLRLIPKRMLLSGQKVAIGLLKEQMDNFAKERDRMVELMKQFNLEGGGDKRRWDVIDNNFKFEQQRIADTSTRHDALAKDLYTKQLEYMKECVTESGRLSRLLVPVLASVRAELEMPLNEAAYMQIIEEGIQKQEARIDEFLQEARRLTAAQPPVAADAASGATLNDTLGFTNADIRGR